MGWKAKNVLNKMFEILKKFLNIKKIPILLILFF